MNFDLSDSIHKLMKLNSQVKLPQLVAPKMQPQKHIIVAHSDDVITPPFVVQSFGFRQVCVLFFMLANAGAFHT